MSRQRAPHLGPERRRPLILDAARHIAVRDGMGAVTIGSIAAEMGVTRSVVYAAFGDRVELMTALMVREQEAITQSLIASLRASGVANEPEKAFVSGFTALLTAAQAHPESWRFVLGGEPDPAMSARAREARAMVQQEATSWIRPAMERWWHTEDLDRKLPVLIELFGASAETVVRLVLDDAQGWSADDLGALAGRSICALFERA